MHYLNGRPANDTSGIKLRFSTQPVPYSAGMVAYASGFSIPPGKPSTLVPNSCCYSGWEPLHGFATRVHTHALGRCVEKGEGVCAGGRGQTFAFLLPAWWFVHAGNSMQHAWDCPPA